MSALRSISEKFTLTIESTGEDHVAVMIDTPAFGRIGATVDRPAFLAAVASDCNAIVIDRAELPAVTADREWVQAGEAENADPYSARPNANPNWTWHYALNALAVYEYMRTRPPVTEADVDALAEILWENAQNPSGPGDRFSETTPEDRNRFRNRAFRVLATGRVQVTS